MNHTQRDEMEIDEKIWKKALTIRIKDFADNMGLSFADVYTFFCEFVCLNLAEDADEEDARELCKDLYHIMVRGIEIRKEQK